MKLSVDHTDSGVVIIAVSGEIDWNNSHIVRSAINPIFRKNPSALVIDLSDVNFIDSSGIATLIEGLQRSLQTKVPFRLSGMAPAVRDIFKMAGLEALFRIFDNREAALKDLDLELP
jgi:anti-sigma B factor antagonist